MMADKSVFPEYQQIGDSLMDMRPFGGLTVRQTYKLVLALGWLVASGHRAVDPLEMSAGCADYADALLAEDAAHAAKEKK